jgi:polyribonucleotide nucleotidyltransferase
LARLADGAAVVKMGDTHVLATACSARTAEEGKDFLPLAVEYREKLMAVGRIPQTFNRREGAPKEREVLVARAVDRPLRPLFPKGYFYETQVQRDAGVLRSYVTIKQRLR